MLVTLNLFHVHDCNISGKVTWRFLTTSLENVAYNIFIPSGKRVAFRRALEFKP